MIYQVGYGGKIITVRSRSARAAALLAFRQWNGQRLHSRIVTVQDAAGLDEKFSVDALRLGLQTLQVAMPDAEDQESIRRARNRAREARRKAAHRRRLEEGQA